jgi:hypothetical protein
MSIAATVWVPLVTAAAGLVAGIGAAMGAAIWTQRRTDTREDVRWERERHERRDQWERERDDRWEQWQREDSSRWQQERQQAYARLIAALYEWDDQLRHAIATRQNDAQSGEESEPDTADIDRKATAARETLALVQFLARKKICTLASRAMGDRESFRITHLEAKPIDVDQLDEGWRLLLKGRFELLAAMQEDLGLQIEPGDN